MGSVKKLRPTAQDIFGDIVNNTIEGIGAENGDLVMSLSNGREVTIWSEDGDLNLTISESDLDA